MEWFQKNFEAFRRLLFFYAPVLASYEYITIHDC
jgi:hypothetical protein